MLYNINQTKPKYITYTYLCAPIKKKGSRLTTPAFYNALSHMHPFTADIPANTESIPLSTILEYGLVNGCSPTS